MKYTPDKIKNYELLDVFPEAKKLLKNKQKEINQRIDELMKEKRDISNQAYLNDEPDNVIEFKEDGMNFLIEKERQELKKIDRIFISDKEGQLDIEKAKEYPVDSLINFVNNKACCVFHDEQEPSLHYYKKTNSVYCWGCHKSGDSMRSQWQSGELILGQQLRG